MRVFKSPLRCSAGAAQDFQTSYGELYLATQRAFDFSEHPHLRREVFEYVKDAFRGVSIPQRQLLDRLLPRAVQRRGRSIYDPARVGADHDIRTQFDSDWPFGIFTQREARNSKRGRLFLDAARISQNKTRRAVKREKVEIT